MKLYTYNYYFVCPSKSCKSPFLLCVDQYSFSSFNGVNCPEDNKNQVFIWSGSKFSLCVIFFSSTRVRYSFLVGELINYILTNQLCLNRHFNQSKIDSHNLPNFT